MSWWLSLIVSLWRCDVSTYARDVESVCQAFDFEYCEECGRDLEWHVIVPFMGHPLVRCLTVHA